MKKVLITGFTPFGTDVINPSYEAVKRLPDQILDAEIIKLEVPTVFYQSLEVVQKAIDTHQPDLVIHVGQAGGRFGITPERVAINLDDARIKDNDGQQPIDLPVVEGGKSAYFTTLPVKSMVKKMQEHHIPASLSTTAGTFVCNHLMYGTLQYLDVIGKMNTVKAGFIHVPYMSEQVVALSNQPSLTLDQIVEGLRLCVEVGLLVDVDNKDAMGMTH